MKRIISLAYFLGAFACASITVQCHAMPVNPQPGENLWHLLASVGTQVDQLQNTCDFAGTFTVFNAILQKDFIINSQLDSLLTNTPDALFAQTFTIINNLALCNPIPFFGGTISSPGHYCLAVNLSGATDPLITVSTSDVLLDLNGHTLSPNIGNDAIVLDDATSRANITIKNGFIEGGLNGIICTFFNSFTNIILEDIQTSLQAGNGFEIHNTLNLLMRNCSCIKAAGGLIIDASNTILIENCVFDQNTAAGAFVNNLSNIIIKCSSFDSNQNIGFGSDGGLEEIFIKQCSFNNNGMSGFFCTHLVNTEISNCSFNGNMSSHGLNVVSVNNLLINNSSFNNNGASGAFINNNAAGKLYQCQANSNTVFGFVLNSSSDILSEKCFACSNGISGFSVTGSSANICCLKCIAKNNTLFGFNTASGTSGLFKECQALANGTAGFSENASFSYVANSAKGNGTNPADIMLTGTDSNYYLDGNPSTFTSPGPGAAPYYQFDLSITAMTDYWDNITMPF